MREKVSQKLNVKKISKTLKQNKKSSIPPLLEVIVVVVKRGRGDEVSNYLKTIGIKGKMIGYGYGTADNALQSILGLYNKEKELVYALIPIAHSNELLDELESQFLKKDKYAGIIFTIPLKSIAKGALDSID